MSKDTAMSNVQPNELEEEIIKSNIPEDKKGLILSSFTEVLRIRGTIGPTNPIVDKLNDEHIRDIIKNSEAINERENSTKKFTLIVSLVSIISALVFFGFVIWIFRSTPSEISHIITPIVTLIGGVMGGFGYGFKKGKDS